MNERCPNCGQLTNSSSSRMIEDTCGHIKCRMCLVFEEQGCISCKFELKQPSDVGKSISPSIQNPNFPLEASKIPSSSPPNICSTIIINKTVETNGETQIPPPPPPPLSPPKAEIKEKSNTKKHQTNRSHIIILPGVPERYQCNVCEKIFRNKKGKCYHDGCITGIQPYHCSVCDRSFVKKSHFEYHERVHSGYKPFKCELCSKAFPQRNKLNRHMLSHSQEKQFLCPKCGKRYCKKDDLKLHMMVHTGTLPHICKSCGKAFRIRSNLNRHMHSHSSERPHVCDGCGKSFKEKSLLARHTRTHGKERPYSCAHCPRVFLSKSELRRHLAIHSETKPFSCTICQTDFRRKDNLNRHIRHHHSEDSVVKPIKVVDKKVKKSKSITTVKPKVNAKIEMKKMRINTMKNSTVVQKNVSKDLVVEVNSKAQINSRIDSMGNITPVIRVPGELSNAVPVINGPISIVRPAEKSDNRKKILSFTEPISRDEAVNINQRIEEKLYAHSVPSSNPCYFPHSSSRIESHLPMSFLPPLRHNPVNPVVVNRSITERRTSDSNLLPPKNGNLIELKSIGALSSSIAVEPEKQVQINEATKRKCTIIMDEMVNVCVKSDRNNRGLIIEGTNCVSTIKKNIISNERTSVVDNKGCEVHWRRRTAEILKPHLN